MNAQDIAEIAQYEHDPLGFSCDAYPWGKVGTELERHTGPRNWQREVLTAIGEHLDNKETRHQPLRIAVASGHGIGKSALIGQIVNWAMSTADDCKIVVTANTEPQLRTKTWPEISKWARLCLNRPWWKVNAMSMHSVDPDHEKSWRADAVTWSENNTEAFAGLHNEGKRIVIIYDEASNIADKVWEVTEGALTDANTEIIWIAFGNPTRNTGRFRECFGKYRHLWKTWAIDSRTVEGVNKDFLAQMVETYGEDSDIVKVRVRGLFPAQSSAQFISTDLVDAAEKRIVISDPGAPLIMGIDIARFGDDQCVIRGRRGRDARLFRPIRWAKLDTVQSAERIMQAIDLHQPQAVFIDGGGVGGGVVDILKSRNYRVTEVNFGSSPRNESKYANKRAEMYGDLRDWLETGAIEPDAALRTDLTGPEYFFDKNSRILLESKDDMKKRGLASPDDADALALTFAHPVARTDIRTGAGQRVRLAVGADSPVLG